MKTLEKSATKISGLSQLLLVLATLLLTASIFTPIWRIDLDAPQYPEGLSLKINANGIGGNVEIINGLNHYIGMKTLHNEDFIEFTLLPYIIGFFAIISLITALVAKKRGLYLLLSAFILFGIIAMIDFWRWEYNYGHNLDPNAAIIVPGMAYQPPLIGFKQLLNFGAYSVPDLGGWLFICSGLCMLFAALYESKFLQRFKKNKTSFVGILALGFVASCSNKGAEPIKLNSDNCDYCQMSISNPRFSAEIVTQKGRIYKFDDLACLINFKKENIKSQGGTNYVSEFLSPHKLLKTDSLFYIQGENIASPMGGNIAAFSNADSAQTIAGRLNAMPCTWQTLNR